MCILPVGRNTPRILPVGGHDAVDPEPVSLGRVSQHVVEHGGAQTDPVVVLNLRLHGVAYRLQAECEAAG